MAGPGFSSPGVPPIAGGFDAFVNEGYTPMLFGTEAFGFGITSSGEGYIALRVRASQRARTIPLLQGSGATAQIIQIIDGQDFEITVIEDQVIVPPIIGQIMVLQAMFLYRDQVGDEPVIPVGDASLTIGNFICVDNNFVGARKDYGTRTFIGRAFALINDISGGGNPGL